MTEPFRIRYRFELPNGAKKKIELKFDARDFRLIDTAGAPPPFWAELTYNQCANCPLQAAEHPHCPAAVHMAPAVDTLKALVSFDTVAVTVALEERVIHTETSAQQALSSVLGLIMATSGCPWTDHLRPMARFHLPFASEIETMYRTVGMFLLARQIMAADSTGGFVALQKLYENLHTVNRDVSRRLGAATKTDPARNAIALLDSYTTLLPLALDDLLEEFKPLFDAWQDVEF